MGAAVEVVASILQQLGSLGCPVDAAITSGSLVVLDAATTLTAFMVNGTPDRVKFSTRVGTLVHRLSLHATHGLRVSGERVDVLAAQRNFHSAGKLEALWNELAAHCSFTLLCGYSSAHFVDENPAHTLENICRRHTQASAHATDMLGNWLLADRLSHSRATS